MQVDIEDLSSNGFGTGWGHSRSYSNQLFDGSPGTNGTGWYQGYSPVLLFNDDGTVGVVPAPNDAQWFRPVAGGGYAAMFGGTATLENDRLNGQYIFTDYEGGKMLFYGDPSPLRGMFKGIIDANGSQTLAKYNEDQHLESFVMGSGNQTSGYYYEYFVGDGVRVPDQISSVTNMVNGQNVRRVNYLYYGKAETGGVQGDLKTAQIEQYDPVQGAWFEINTSYYRYYTTFAFPGFPSGLKYVVGPEAYARMLAAGIKPEEATDDELSKYADYFFEYDVYQRVTKEVVDGGAYTYGFAYWESGNTEGFNSWSMKTVETLPDGNRNVVYSNHAGQVMLKVFQSAGEEQYTYYKFDHEGKGILKAESSAVAGYDEEKPELVTLRKKAGLIHTYEYYGDPTEEGYAPGYSKSESVKNGSQGKPTMLRSTGYVTRTVGGNSIYLPASQVVYQSDVQGGSDPAQTTYQYTFFDGQMQVQQMTTILPLVPVAQNGSGKPDSKVMVYDQYGNPTWAKDERGFITYTPYDAVTGALVQRIQDVDTTQVSGAPAGWSTPQEGGLNLVTDYQFDLQGRTTQELGPLHSIDLDGTATSIRRATWMVYRDDIDQQWSGSGYATGTPTNYQYTLINPVNIVQMDQAERVTENIQALRTSGSGVLNAGDSFPQASWSRWTNTYYSDQSQITYKREYFSIPAEGAGTPDANYNETVYGYDAMGRQNRVQTPGGTITRTIYVPCGCSCDCQLVLQSWVGTNDTGATDTDPSGGGAQGNNMVVVTVNEYDNGKPGGDDNLTQTTNYQDANTTRVTAYGYDYRNRRSYTDGEIDFYESYTYDNLDRLIQTDRLDTSASGNLVARNASRLDPRGRTYQSIVYGVDPVNGKVGNSLTSNRWYDPSGNLIKNLSPGSQAFQKFLFDGINRPTAQYTSYNPTETGYPYPINISGDTVVEQVQSSFDPASNTIAQITSNRFNNATGTGGLNGPAGSQPEARVSYQAFYPDALGRQVVVANYGTNGAAAWTRPDIIPASSDTILVSATLYNDRGEAYQTIDPQGTVKQSIFDDAARLTVLLENYVAGGSGSGQNKETDYTYNPDSKIATLTAKNSVTGDQVTTFIYGTTLDDSDIASNELLRFKQYPDSTSTNPDQVTSAYNRLGQLKQLTDPNGTVHQYDYDELGRLTADRITTLASGVDKAVLRISRTYEVRGLLQNVTSYDNATVGSGNVVNDVELTYNNFQKLAADYQSHSGAVNPSTTPSAQYGYADGSANTTRPISLTYPNGRALSYGYDAAGSMADALSRISTISDTTAANAANAAYQYLGLGTIVEIGYGEAGIEMTYIQQGSEPVGDAGDQYTGLDRFGRVVDSRWINGSGVDIDRFEFGYSPASIRMWRQNIVAGQGQDEYYTYDGLYQLDQLQRGTLNAAKNGINGTPGWEEDFTYDPVGNWENYLTKVSGNPSLDQNRTHNVANEVTAIGGSSSLVAYDVAGNMTTTPMPADWASGYTLTWDAWNRLVSVVSAANGTNVVATYAYDGLTRRTVKTTSTQARDYYYSDKWQILEERAGQSTSADQQFVWGLRDVDDIILRDTYNGQNAQRLYATRDPMHVTAITDNTGAIQERYGYDAFGTTLFMTPAFAQEKSSSFNWETTFCSYRLDSDTGFYQVRYRYLHPALGRWLSRDPIEEKIDSNLYRYAGNIPNVITDPLGLGDIPNEAAETFTILLAALAASMQVCPNSETYFGCQQCCSWLGIAQAASVQGAYAAAQVTCLTVFVIPWKYIRCQIAVHVAFVAALKELRKLEDDCLASCLKCLFKFKPILR